MQNIHTYTQYTKVQSVYIIRQAKIDKGTKPFCFCEWSWIGLCVCVSQSHYELSTHFLSIKSVNMFWFMKSAF